MVVGDGRQAEDLVQLFILGVVEFTVLVYEQVVGVSNGVESIELVVVDKLV